MAAGDPRGYYEILGVRRTASAEEIRAAFRQRAKQYHPDRGGSAEDEARFRHLREAFETLRDPQRRLRYDNEALASGPRAGNAGRRPRSGQAAAAGRAARQAAALLASFKGWARQPATRSAAARFVGAWLPLAVTVVLLAVVAQRLASQDRAIAALGQRLDAATAPSAASAPPSPDGSVLFQAELLFPRGSAELTPAHRARVDATLSRLRGAIAALPPAEDWRVVLDGRSPHLPEAAGAAGAWDLTVRRLEAAAGYLVQQGVPPARLAARFQAGAPPPGEAPSVPEALQLVLLCCRDGATAAAAR